MINWEMLLTDIGIEWRRTGKNTSRHDINICCPFCGDDYGFHLGISLEKENAYYCLRYPDDHSGRSIPYLLRTLGVNSTDIPSIIDRYNTETLLEVASPPALGSAASKWRNFLHLRESKAAVSYMRDIRGFENVEELGYRYDLRVARVGKWAQRILFPIYQENHIVSWTGRAIKRSMVPKYLMHSAAHPGLVYATKPFGQVAAIVEGPMDALKIAAADSSFLGIALMGKQVNSSKLLAIKQLIKHSRKVFFLSDNDVPYNVRNSMAQNIKQVIRSDQEFSLASIPVPYKDAAEMPLNELKEFLRWNE